MDSEVGMDALALAFAALESGESGKIIKIEDVISGKSNSYQKIIDDELNI